MPATEVQSRCRTTTPPRSSRSQQITQAIFERVARLLCRFWCRIHVSGRDNLPDAPFLICANHASHLDSIALMIAAGQSFDRFAIIAADDYFFDSKLRRFGFKYLLNLISIERHAAGSSIHRTLAECTQFLNQGNRNLILFPEGTRSATGKIGTFKAAAALFPIRLGIPVIPVFIGGSGRVLPKGRFFPRSGSIEVSIGKPLWARGGSSTMAEAWIQITAMRDHLDE